MNGGRDLSEMQEESLKMMAMMVSMMRTGTANDDRIGDVPDHHLFSPEERMVIGSDQIAMPEAPSAPFREVS